MCNGNSKLYADSYSNADRYANTNSNSESYAYPNSDRDSDTNSYSYGYRQTYTHCQAEYFPETAAHTSAAAKSTLEKEIL